MLKNFFTSLSTKQKIGVAVLVLVFLVVVVISVGYFIGWWRLDISDDYSDITSYEECILVDVAIIQESYPEVCVLPDGSSFVHEIEGLDSEIGE